MGTNPIACCAPAADGDSFALDMATSTCALGKVSQLTQIKKSYSCSLIKASKCTLNGMHGLNVLILAEVNLNGQG